MDVTRLTSLGKGIQSRIRTFFDTPLDATATPLEITQAVLDEVERQVQAVSRGRRVFPFVEVTVRVCGTSASRPAMAAAFDGFGARIRERLTEVRCDPPRLLDVRVDCLDAAPAEWAAGRVFDVSFVADPALAAAGPAAAASAARGTATSIAPPVLHVTVLAGTVEPTTGRFTEGTVSIGRSADPEDGLGRVRRNRLAFVDVVDGINETVGRAHARLRSDAVTREVRVFDEGSRNGTSILRDGEVITVHRRDPRGVRLRSGDEIRLGRAVLRIEIDEEDRTAGSQDPRIPGTQELRNSGTQEASRDNG
jgi:hypothetical protein